MLKITKQNGEVNYILEEKERVKLPDQQATELLKDRLNNIEKYITKNDKGICFFTNKEVEHDLSGWYFNVEIEGKMHQCMYDNNIDKTDDGYELMFYMWRNGDSGSYTEHIGNCINLDGTITTVDDTNYSDVEEYYSEKGEEKQYLKLTNININDVRQYYFK